MRHFLLILRRANCDVVSQQSPILIAISIRSIMQVGEPLHLPVPESSKVLGETDATPAPAKGNTGVAAVGPD